MGLNNQDFGAGQGTFLDTGTTLFFANSKIYKFYILKSSVKLNIFL